MTPKEKPVQTHRGAEIQRSDYARLRSGANTTRHTIPEARHPQNKNAKGYGRRPK